MGTAARRADELGFSSISVSDHVVATVGAESSGAGSSWPDWSVLATYLAMRTETIRIVSSNVVPYRSPLIHAKQIATIDQVSGGRFTLAAAVGWLAPEFRMLGVERGRRGAITDEYLRAMKVLWSEDSPRFEGEFVSFEDVVFEPRCVQRPHVPIWIAGGSGPGPMRRLLELGEGWMPMGGDLDAGLRDDIARIKEGVAERGRDPEAMTFRYTIGVGEAEGALEALSGSIGVDDPSTVGAESPEQVAVEIDRYAEAGFNELALQFAADSAAAVIERMEWFAAEVMPLVGGAGGTG
jgi:probable F420-dependent oxidoreductase